MYKTSPMSVVWLIQKNDLPIMLWRVAQAYSLFFIIYLG